MQTTGLIRAHQFTLARLIRLVDGALIVGALYLACVIYTARWETQYLLAGVIAAMTYNFMGELTGLHRNWRSEPPQRQLFRIWGTWSLVVPLLLVIAFFAKVSEDFSRVSTLLWCVTAPIVLTVRHSFVRLFANELRRRGRNTRSVAIVGATPSGATLAREIAASPWFGLRVRGVYDDRHPHNAQKAPSRDEADRRFDPMAKSLADYRGPLGQLVDDARRGKIDHVYVALPLRAEQRIRELIRRLADTTASVHIVSDLFVSDLLNTRWSSLGPVPIFSVFETPFEGLGGWLKRAEDIVVGAAILTLIATPMAVIALAVKLTSSGPVLFRQRRYGLNGQPITVLKFRTMSVCEDGDRIEQARRDDPRVTPIGAFLRRTSLDELPQFLNVLTGEMSIVGPRPHAVAHNELYRKLIHGYMLRHKVKPGITGWAQVNGWRGETDTLDKMVRRIEHDLAYIRSWSVWLDIKIILLTVFGSSARRNAH